MKRSISIVAGVLVALAAGCLVGCSSSSSSAPETPRIDGKTPAEYREAMEKGGGVAVDGKAPKVRGKRRSMRD